MAMGTQSDRNNEQRYKGWENPGQEKIIESRSEAVPSPSQTADERIDAPDGYIQSIDERPGDANPALGDTLAYNQGTESTADLLRARETAEEERLRNAGGQAYADQGTVLPEEWADKDKGRPNFPLDRQEQPIEYTDSPRIESSYGATGAQGGTGIDSQQLEAEVDRMVAHESNVVNETWSRTGMPQIGANAEEDKYAQREVGRPSPPSETDMLSHGSPHLPPEDDNG
jgi:hypothetical protein